MEIIDDGFRNYIVEDCDDVRCEDVPPGEFCPDCGSKHCTNPAGHSWGDDDFCRHCGADGRG